MLSPGARSGKRKHGYRRRGCRADTGVGGPGRDRGVDVASQLMMVVSGLGGSSELGAGRLLERGTELGRLEQLAQRARTGTGALAVIAGPAGIGKTRLLEHACAAVGADAQLLRARGGELERTFPLWSRAATVQARIAQAHSRRATGRPRGHAGARRRPRTTRRRGPGAGDTGRGPLRDSSRGKNCDGFHNAAGDRGAHVRERPGGSASVQAVAVGIAGTLVGGRSRWPCASSCAVTCGNLSSGIPT